MTHFICLRLSSLGDVVLSTAFLAQLKAEYPGCKISFVTLDNFSALIVNHSQVDEVISFEKDDINKGIKHIINSPFYSKNSIVVDLHGVTKTWKIRLKLWQNPQFVIEKRRWSRTLLVRIGEKIFRLLKLDNIFSLHENQVFRVQNDLRHVLFKLKESCKTSLPEFKLNFIEKLDLPQNYIVISPVASFDAKRYPIQKYNDLLAKLLSLSFFENYSFVILGGPDDHYAKSLSSDNSRVFNLVGKTNLEETCGILKNAHFCIGNDSGVNHIAEAYGTPVLTLFGATSSLFGFNPYLKKSDYIQGNALCSPCSQTGKRNCFRKEKFCFASISFSDILTKIESGVSKR